MCQKGTNATKLSNKVIKPSKNNKMLKIFCNQDFRCTTYVYDALCAFLIFSSIYQFKPQSLQITLTLLAYIFNICAGTISVFFQPRLQVCSSRMGSDLQDNKKELVALSSAQRNIWFDQVIYPHACGYNIGFFIEFDGEIDPTRMGRALNEAVNSLQTMRAVFTTIGDEPYQYVLDECEVPMPLFDVRQATSPKQASNEIINHHIRQPFALTRDLNCRFGLIRLEEKKWIWFGACHHIILDGVGGALLIDALAHAYRHDTSMHPRIPDAWRVALALDEDYLNSADFEADGKYWETN